MKSPPNILSMTDLTDLALPALDRAYRLAAEGGGRLTLLHVIRQRTTDQLRKLLGQDASSVVETLRAKAQEGLQALAAEFGEKYGVSAQSKLVAGKLLRSIIDEAAACDADMLVLGSSDGDFLVSSTATRLLRLTSLPILVVKRPPRGSYEKALIPLDLSVACQKPAGLALQIAPHADLSLFHAFETPFDCTLRHTGIGEDVIRKLRGNAQAEAYHQLKSAAARLPGEVHVRLVPSHCDAAQSIFDETSAYPYDLIVMGRRGANMVEEFLLGSVTKRILAEASADVFVVS